MILGPSEFMSRQLAIASGFSILAMAMFAMFTPASAEVAAPHWQAPSLLAPVGLLPASQGLFRLR